MFLFIFEGLGTSELLLILVVALVLFGPRKLPQLSRSLGKSLANFKRASEDFKETWEKEVARESAIKEALVGEAMLPEDRSILGEPRDRSREVIEASENDQPDSPAASATAAPASDDDATVARGAAVSAAQPEDAPTRKRDWL
ncbi:MAG TPA: twin-arginine translocase TatA/TatE family subunit [Pyrinomonadaceae bacterium]|nr:twin-arginine translocase TatA/TatE family subunit [Pyrinomonadaceae bacterium]